MKNISLAPFSEDNALFLKSTLTCILVEGILKDTPVS
jgi:hypothetical protein